MIIGFLHFATYMSPCHAAVLSKQQLADTPKYDSYDHSNVLIRNDELASSLNTL